MLQPTLRGLHTRDSKTSGRKTTRSVWVRCLECTRKLHRFQRVVGLGAAVYLHLRVHSLLRQRPREGNRYTASPIRHEVAIPRRTQAVQCPRLTAHGIEGAGEVITPSARQLNSQRFEVELTPVELALVLRPLPPLTSRSCCSFGTVTFESVNSRHRRRVHSSGVKQKDAAARGEALHSNVRPPFRARILMCQAVGGLQAGRQSGAATEPMQRHRPSCGTVRCCQHCNKWWPRASMR